MIQAQACKAVSPNAARQKVPACTRYARLLCTHACKHQPADHWVQATVSLSKAFKSLEDTNQGWRMCRKCGIYADDSRHPPPR